MRSVAVCSISPDILHIVLPAEPLRPGLGELGAAQPPADDEVLATKLVIGRIPSCRTSTRPFTWLKTGGQEDTEDPVKETKLSFAEGEEEAKH